MKNKNSIATSSYSFMAETFQFFLVREGGFVESLQLFEAPAVKPPAIQITEYDRVHFVLRSLTKIQPWLYIQDFEMEEPSQYETNDYFEYRWKQSAWFLNHFGYSSLTLDVSTGQQRIEQYAAIEVFANKLNEERAEQILNYLESRMEDVTRSCFNATHKRADVAEEGDTSVSILLQTIDKHLKVMSPLLPYFRNRKRKRLVPTPTQIKANSATHLTEHSIGWVVSHLDTLLPVANVSPSTIIIGGRFYDLDQIETNVLVEETNVYENQVIVGYLESISVRLSELETFYSKQLELVETEGFVAEIPYGFSSIFEIKRKFGRKHYGKLLAECRMLQQVCSDQIAFLQKYIPVKLTIKAMPKLTPGFLASPHYYQSFQKIVEWYRIGRLNLLGERYLYGLRTIDKLYEFFCLFRLLETIKQLGWRIVSQESGPQPMRRQASPEWSANPDSIYISQNAEGERLSLYYEPAIGRGPNSQCNLIRTSAGGNNLEPDFVIEFQYADNTPSTYAILDAKYVKPNSALYMGRDNRYEDYLTKLTMKYFHGVGSRSGGVSPVVAILVLHPKDFNNTVEISQSRSYHSKYYDVSSARPVFPILGAIEVSPEKSEWLEDLSNPDSLGDVFEKLIGTMQAQN